MSESWFYLSFATDDEFLGGVYVQGFTDTDALFNATARKLNPGGEVAMWGPLSSEDLDENVPPADRYRLLTKQELGAAARA